MTIERRKPLTATIGIFGVGHATYWEQFPGLREELLGYLEILEEQVVPHGCDIATGSSPSSSIRHIVLSRYSRNCS